MDSPSGVVPHTQKGEHPVSVEENKAIVRRFIEEVWNQHKLDAFDEIVAADYAHHDEPCADLPTVQDFRDWIALGYKGFPDSSHSIEDVIGERDRVVVRGATSGTHTEQVWHVAPTGRAFKSRWVYTVRLSGGKIVEGWMNWDRMGLQLQLEGKV